MQVPAIKFKFPKPKSNIQTTDYQQPVNFHKLGFKPTEIFWVKRPDTDRNFSGTVYLLPKISSQIYNI